eukprot:gene1640-33031_t
MSYRMRNLQEKTQAEIMKEQEALLMAKYGGMKPKKKPGIATKVQQVTGGIGTRFSSAPLDHPYCTPSFCHHFACRNRPAFRGEQSVHRFCRREIGFLGHDSGVRFRSLNVMLASGDAISLYLVAGFAEMTPVVLLNYLNIHDVYSPAEHKFFDSADWALGKEQAGQHPGQQPQAPLAQLPPKLEPTPVPTRRISHLDAMDK